MLVTAVLSLDENQSCKTYWTEMIPRAMYFRGRSYVLWDTEVQITINWLEGNG